jgi:transcriptional regulator with XRE-family HTH domain
VTPAQCRAARRLLKWSQDDLATMASVSLLTVWNLENEKFKTRPATLAAIWAALKAAGVYFTYEGEVQVSLKLSKNHITLLEQLAEKQRVTWGAVPEGCGDLERAGYVVSTAVNPSEILTVITDAGRQALADAKGQLG